MAWQDASFTFGVLNALTVSRSRECGGMVRYVDGVGRISSTCTGLDEASSGSVASGVSQHMVS